MKTNIFNLIFPTKTAYAHCDIPCGIYDPHLAQVAAHTVIRMVNLMDEAEIKSTASSRERKNIIHQISRYTQVKEEHAELVKHEIRTLWGDYFKPEHVEKFPELHDLVFKTMKLASQARQEVNPKASKELLEIVQKISEIFWETKGLEPVKVSAPYPSAGEIILHK